MKQLKHYLSLASLLLATSLFQQTALASGGSLFDSLGMNNQDDILDVDEAFKLSTETTGNTFIAHLQITEGHYLYRDKVQILIDDPEVQPGQLQLPEGESKNDPVFNEVLYVYHHDTDVVLPFQYTGSGD